MAENKNEILDTDLDTLTMDAIEDMPAFMPLPTGAFLLTGLKWEQKDVNEKPVLEVALKLSEVLELAATDLEADEKAPEPGSEHNFMFMLNNKFGLASLKEFLAPIAVKHGVGKIPDLLNILADGTNVCVIHKRTFDKKKDKFYGKIKKIELAD